VHVASNILFVLFIFYSCLPLDAAHFGPTSHCRASKPGHPGTASASWKRRPVVVSPPLPLFPFPLTALAPLLFHTASPPCSTSMPLMKRRRHRAAPSPSKFRDSVLLLANTHPTVVPTPRRWRRGMGKCMRSRCLSSRIKLLPLAPTILPCGCSTHHNPWRWIYTTLPEHKQE
jgi:hypothetical protein